MKHQVKKFLPLICLALTAAGGCLLYTQQNRPVESADAVPSAETFTEAILETDLSAAASAQTEMDMISESIIQSDSAPVITTETTTQPESLPVTAPASSSSSPETTAVLTTYPSETEVFSVGEEETFIETETFITPESVSTETSVETFTEISVEPISLKPSYHDVLETIFRERSFQGDTFTLLNESDISENEFAIYDVDHDGMDELILRWSNTDSSSVSGVIYGYDNQGNIFRKLLTTPYLRFYSNGVIEADVAHHSALAGKFWEYTLYQYDAASNCYQEIAFVDAWDKSVSDIHWNTQEAFPDYADKSLSGLVYYIYPFASASTDPLDITEYQSWHINYIGGASELNIPFRKLTEANINEIP